MKKVILKANKAKFLDRKHPWIFSGALHANTELINDGDLVEVYNENESFAAIGLFQPGSIAVRILSFEKVEINQEFWDEKINAAVTLRKSLGLISKTNNICRIVHGEGDNLPGLIIDYYNGTAVFQAHAVGMYKFKNEIVNALINALKEELTCVYSKSASTLPDRLNIKDEYLYNTQEVPHNATENEIEFSINWEEGQKTGFFIDQRDNRKRLMKFCENKKVLNTFCYSGGFSLYALKAGAREVHSLDSSQKAIDLVEQNLKINEFSGIHKSIVTDAVKYIQDVDNDYDVIILDPPAFAKHKNKRHQAIKAYTRLNYHAIRQIKSKGIIFTFSCSQVVQKEQFKSAVIAAAIKSKRNVQIIGELTQPADHPINAFHPEGDYLKGLIIRVG